MKQICLALLLCLLPIPSFAAAVTSLGETWNTTAGNKTVTATPAVNDLIVVIHGISNWASGDDSVITDDQGGTYAKFGTATAPLSTGGGTVGALWVSVRNQLVSSAVSTIYTATNTGDTGGGLTVLKVTSMTRTGVNAVLQNIGESTQTENPPSVAFAAATNTNNPIIVAVFGEDNPAALTAPTSFTERTDTGWATPTSGIEVATVDSGQTGTSYAWSGGALTDHNEVGIELNSDSTPQVFFDTFDSVSAGSNTTISGSITVNAGHSNGAVVLALYHGDAATASSITCNVGGSSATAVSGADSGSNTGRVLLFVRAIGTSSGATSYDCSWTTSVSSILTAVSVYNVAQGTPMTNGVNKGKDNGTPTLGITSTSNGMTISAVVDISGAIPVSTNQTLIDTDQAPASALGSGVDRATGTGSSITHTWTLTGANNNAMAGANLVLATAGVTRNSNFIFAR